MKNDKESTKIHFDKDRLKKRIGDNKELIIELVEIAKEQLTDTVQQMKTAFEEKDYKLIGKIVHKTKGFSGSMNFDMLVEISRKLESAIKQNQMEFVAKITKEFIEECDYLVLNIV